MFQSNENLEQLVSRNLYGRFLALLVILLAGGAMAREDLPCERQTIALSISPDNNWVALVKEGVCMSGALTVSTDTVRIERRDSISEVSLVPRPEKSEHENDVLVVEYYGNAKNRPRLQWHSPSKLEIAIPNISGVGLQKVSYEGIDVVIKYEPDDPAAREKWRKERGLPPR